MSLTKHTEGSLRELWTLAFPLMLTSLSVVTMVFSDRWLLAQYSTSAHNAAVSATTFGWAFIFSWMSLAGITEVFVAQYNGAGLRHKMGEPVWQMIWVSLGSWLFFLPLSYWGTGWVYGNGIESALERDYFSIMLLFGPLYVLYTSLCGFFIGQGKTKLITWVVIAANLFNILFDWILIFGVEGWIPSLGVKGAAIATSAATFFQCLALGFAFLSKKNRNEFGTFSWKPRLKALKECVRVGFPTSIFVFAEISAFGCYYIIMKEKGAVYITVAGICQTMIILFFFFAEGINKATTAIAGNLIGAGRSFVIPKVMKAGFKLNVVFLICVLALFVLSTPLIIAQFLPLADPFFIAEIQEPLQFSLILFAFYLFFDGLRLQFGGVLTASGDTLFLLLGGASLVWMLMWLPVYLLIAVAEAPVETGAIISVCYSAIACLVYFWRISRNQRKSIRSLVS